METKKTYIGGGRQKPGSEYITLHLGAEDLMHLCSDTLIGEERRTITLVVARRRKPTAGGGTHLVYVPQRPTESELKEAAHAAIADQQEMEVRAWDEANA